MAGNSKLTVPVAALLPPPAYNEAYDQSLHATVRGSTPRRVALLGVWVGGGALLVAACGGSPSNAAVAHLRTTTTTLAAGAQKSQFVIG